MDIDYLTYFAIGFQETINQTSFSLMSNLDWQKTFKAQGFALYDPIRKAALKSTKQFFSFDQISCHDSFGREIMRQRKRHGICDGFVIMERHLGHNYMLTIATDYSRFDSFNFYMNYKQDLRIILKDLKKLIMPETKTLIMT